MPESSYSKNTVNRVLFTLASLVIIIAGVKAADELFVPFLMALLVAIVASPALLWFVRLGISEWLAMILVVLIMLGAAVGVGMLVGNSIDDFQRALPTYEVRLRELVGSGINWVNKYGLSVSSESLLKYLDPAQAMKLVGRTVNAFGGVLTNSFFILLTAIFLLFELAHFPDKMRSVLKDADQSISQFSGIALNVNRYLGIKTLASIATGVFITIWLYIVGVDFPVLWGLLAFLLNYVPNIGSIIAAVPAVLLGLVELGVGHALWAGGGYLIANMVIGNIIEPRFMGRGLGLSTLVVFVSLVFWGWVLGPVGMFLSVPLTMAVKVALESNESSRWIAVMLGSDVPVVDNKVATSNKTKPSKTS